MKKAEEAIESLTDSLKTQIATFGMGQRQADLYKAALQVWKLPVEEQERFNSSLNEMAEMIRWLDKSEGFKKLKDDLKEMNDKLRDQIRFFGISEDQQAAARLRERAEAMPRSTAADEARWSNLQVELFGMDQLLQKKRELEQAEKDRKKLLEEHQRIIEDVKTPYEKLIEKLQKINSAEGLALGQETRTRAVAKAMREAAEAAGLASKGIGDIGSFKTFEAGSVDVQALSIGARTDPIVGAIETQTEEQKRQTELLRQMVRSGGLPS
jgi:hypothetical protein